MISLITISKSLQYVPNDDGMSYDESGYWKQSNRVFKLSAAGDAARTMPPQADGDAKDSILNTTAKIHCLRSMAK